MTKTKPPKPPLTSLEEALCDDGMLTVPEARAFLKVSSTSLYYWMEIGELPYTKFGRARRIPKKALITFAALRTTTSRSVKRQVVSLQQRSAASRWRLPTEPSDPEGTE